MNPFEPFKNKGEWFRRMEETQGRFQDDEPNGIHTVDEGFFRKAARMCDRIGNDLASIGSQFVEPIDNSRELIGTKPRRPFEDELLAISNEVILSYKQDSMQAVVAGRTLVWMKRELVSERQEAVIERRDIVTVLDDFGNVLERPGDACATNCCDPPRVISIRLVSACGVCGRLRCPEHRTKSPSGLDCCQECITKLPPGGK